GGLPGGIGLAGVNEFRRRRWETEDAEADLDEDSATSALKSLGMGLGVTIALNLAASGERLFAAGVSKVLAKILATSDRVLRPVGHAAALSVIGVAIFEMLRRVDHKIEHGAGTLEEAFAVPPTTPLVSGGPDSLVAWDSLSRQGRRNVSTVLSPAQIEAVMGEPAVAQP